jgi:phosphoribosylformylglycinamidine synthase
MASQGSVGMSVNLDLVPIRESDMSGYEMMLSESQERMLAITKPERAHEVISVFQKWGIHAVIIGHVTDNGIVTVTRNGEVIADVDPKLLTDHCPVYHSEQAVPEYFIKAESFDPNALVSTDLHQNLLTLLALPDIASKRYVFEQYDQQVQTQTIHKAGAADAATIFPAGSKKAFSVKIDGNSRWTRQHPRRGGQLAVVEAARNVACTGAKPVAVTDGLNFGNPQQPHVYWQFAEAVEGIAEASEALETPVISGNVSFYNESELGEIPPTPMIGMLGILDSPSDTIGMSPNIGDSLALLSVPNTFSSQRGLGASAFLQAIHGIEDGYPEAPNLLGEKNLCWLLYELAKQGIITCAHDVSDGGVSVLLAEMVIASGNGLSANIGSMEQLFAEFPGQVVVGTTNLEKLQAVSSEFQIQVEVMGLVNNSQQLQLEDGHRSLNWSLDELTNAFEGTFTRLLN